ncbi:MAG TPA: histidine kinase [Burkholderiales bacterium]|nr:histidine kinase [Burkholderiales bacterium]
MSPNSTSVPDALPDFRNLGVAARILVGVNVGAFVTAAIKATSFSQLVSEFLEIALVVEPVLIAGLALLSVTSRWLARLPHLIGLATVAAMVLILTAGAAFLRASVDAGPLGIVRAGAFALLTTAVLAGYFHLRSRAFSPALSEARLQALQARIRPHFLFNTLNAVLSLIRKDARRAEAAIEDLAELYRMVMADAKNLTTLAREVDLTRQYLNLEQLRLGERLVIDWQIADAPRDALVPPLLLQPLVENAVYHGIEPGVGPGTIVIAIRRERDRMHVKLTNPYHPDYQHRQGNRIALANIRERLALHFDVEGVLESGVNGSSYEIRMTMPYRRAAPHTVPGERAAA